MRLIRFLLAVVFFGALGLWIDAAAHGFHGAYCFSSGGCESSGINFPGHTVLWLAPVAMVATGVLLSAIRRARLR